MKLNSFIILCGIFYSATMLGQKTTIFTESKFNFKKGVELYEKGVYAGAQQYFKKALEQTTYPTDNNSRVIRTQAEIMYAKSVLKAGRSEGEKLMLDFYRDRKPDAASDQAILELGNFAYNKKKYDEAIEYYSMIEGTGLSTEEYTELKFKLAYANFVNKNFTKARESFNSIRNIQNKYYYPANYYFGMASYFDKKYDQAIQGFKVCAAYKKYKNLVPYYICQIYYGQKKYQEVIDYGTTLLNDPDIQKKSEVNQLIGQSYFQLGRYSEALPYMEEYASNSSGVSPETMFQIGYTYYKNGNYPKAIEYLKECDQSNTPMGQNALYFLADSYIKTKDKPSAKNAFMKASNMNFDAEMTENSKFNYAKLSAEMNGDREAVMILSKIPQGSKYYAEAQKVLGDVLENTKDYDNAIKIIESIDQPNEKLKEAYQKICYQKGLQEYNNKAYEGALAYFIKSDKYPINKSIKTLISFWRGDIYHLKKDFPASIEHMDNYIADYKLVKVTSDISTLPVAQYVLGFSQFKLENYSDALKSFESAVNGIKKNNKIKDAFVNKNVLGDAVMKAGDCNFKKNNYKEALALYNEAIDNKYEGFIYAMFQKGIIQGLDGDKQDKINTLSEIPNRYPNSLYADQALYELGKTHQEMEAYKLAKGPLTKLVTNYKDKSKLVNKSYILLGLISYNSGEKESALTYYKNVFNNNPSKEDAEYARAAIEEIYLEMGRADDYIEYIETIPGYKMSKDSKDSLNFRVAQNHFELGNWQNAITGFDEYLKKFPNGANTLQAYYSRGESYLALKKYDKALIDFEKVIEKGNSEYYVVSLDKAAIIAYHHSNAFAQAYTYYSKLEKVARTEDKQFQAQLGALRSAHRSQNQDGVAEYAVKVANNPKSSADEKALSNYYLGKLNYDRNDLGKASEYFTKALKGGENEQTAESRYMLAKIYYDQEKWDEAEQACNTAIEGNSGFPYWIAKSLLLISDTQVKKSDYFNARAALEAVVENFEGDKALVDEAKKKLKELDQIEGKLNRVNLKTNESKTLEMEEN